jgi:hypothetical protein
MTALFNGLAGLFCGAVLLAFMIADLRHAAAAGAKGRAAEAARCAAEARAHVTPAPSPAPPPDAPPSRTRLEQAQLEYDRAAETGVLLNNPGLAREYRRRLKELRTPAV